MFTTAIKHFCHSSAHSKAFRGTTWSFYRSSRGSKGKWCLADRVQQAKSHRVQQEERHTHTGELVVVPAGREQQVTAARGLEIPQS